MRKGTKGIGLMVLGLTLMLSAVGLSVYNNWDSDRAGAAAGEVVEKLEQLIVTEPTVLEEDSEQSPEEELPDYVRYPEMEMPVVSVDGREYVGLLEIPALELELPVLSQWSDSGAKVAPCRYTGSVYLDNMVIAGHNYVKHFHDLRDLSQGDEVVFTDAAGNVFRFRVASIETLPADAVEDMCETDWPLTLFTCTYSGADRVTIRCVKE